MKKEKDKEKKKKKRQPEFLPPLEKETSSAPAEASSQDSLTYFSLVAGGKWKLRVLWALSSGSLRYGEIKAEISGITDMMLSQSLKELTADGLILRRQYQEIPPKVEYRLAKDALSLVPILQQLCDWSKPRAAALGKTVL